MPHVAGELRKQELSRTAVTSHRSLKALMHKVGRCQHYPPTQHLPLSWTSLQPDKLSLYPFRLFTCNTPLTTHPSTISQPSFVHSRHPSKSCLHPEASQDFQTTEKSPFSRLRNIIFLKIFNYYEPHADYSCSTIF